MDKEQNLKQYKEELEVLKRDCERKIKILADNSKVKIIAGYEDVLGDEYVQALERGRRFSEKYNELISLAFEYAAQGDGRELVMEISSFSKNNEKDKKKKVEIVYQLLDRLMDVLEDDYPDLVSLIKHAQNDLTLNEANIAKMLKGNSCELDEVKNNVKSFFKKELEAILYSFKQDIDELRKKYCIADNVNESVKIAEISEPHADSGDYYIPFRKGKGTIN